MDERDVVITGVGMVTPLGATAEECARAWREGRSALRAPLVELAGTPAEDTPIAQLPDFDPAQRLGSRRMLKYMSDAAVLGCVAAREALHDAGVSGRFEPERIGLYAGSGLAAASVSEVQTMVEESIDEAGAVSCRLLGERGLPGTNPLLSFKILANMPPCLVSIIETIKGPNFVFTPWEGQTGAALLEACRAVASGQVDCALAGAADSAGHASTFVYLRQAGLLGDDELAASAAGYLVLESAESASRDGRRVYAHVANVQLTAADKGISDPLADRLGRTFAAAPGVLVGLAAMVGEPDAVICGVDQQRLTVELRRAS